MGDWILFRGSRRFVIRTSPGTLVLERVRGAGGPAYYSVSEKEKATVRVVKASTVRARGRARKLLEDSCLPWTKIVWDGDEATYVHDEAKFP